MDENRRLGKFPWVALRSIARSTEFGLVVGIAVALAVIYLLDRNGAFFSPYSRQTMLHQVALFGILAVGAAVVIISGGIDLSIGAVVALSSIICAKLLTSWLRGGTPASVPPSLIIVALGIALTLFMGLCIGFLHALMINSFSLPPFIATLATMAGLRSLAAIISQNRTTNVRYDSFRVLGNNPWWTLTIFGLVALAVSIMMGSTVVGRHLFALGGNETAARLSGLSTRRLKVLAYGLSGALAALGGVLFTGRSGQADPRLGVAYELIAITAAVVGGCSLSGGVGSIRGTVLGLFLIQIIIKGTGQVVRPVALDLWFFVLHIPQIDSTQVEGLVLGTVVVLAVAFNQRFRRRG
jgi:ribose/xylose/arabinose/galactoside ABC-type transport system permease subunit